MHTVYLIFAVSYLTANIRCCELFLFIYSFIFSAPVITVELKFYGLTRGTCAGQPARAHMCEVAFHGSLIRSYTPYDATAFETP